jgi:hypothetical protein
MTVSSKTAIKASVVTSIRRMDIEGLSRKKIKLAVEGDCRNRMVDKILDTPDYRPECSPAGWRQHREQRLSRGRKATTNGYSASRIKEIPSEALQKAREDFRAGCGVVAVWMDLNDCIGDTITFHGSALHGENLIDWFLRGDLAKLLLCKIRPCKKDVPDAMDGMSYRGWIASQSVYELFDDSDLPVRLAGEAQMFGVLGEIAHDEITDVMGFDYGSRFDEIKLDDLAAELGHIPTNLIIQFDSAHAENKVTGSAFDRCSTKWELRVDLLNQDIGSRACQMVEENCRNARKLWYSLQNEQVDYHFSPGCFPCQEYVDSGRWYSFHDVDDLALFVRLSNFKSLASARLEARRALREANDMVAMMYGTPQGVTVNQEVEHFEYVVSE